MLIRFYLCVVVVILSCSNGKDNLNKIPDIIIAGIKTDITSDVIKIDEVSTFFDNNLESGSYLKAGNGYDLKCNFSEPVYIKEIELYIDIFHDKQSDEKYRPTNLRIEISQDDNFISCDAVIYKIDYNKNLQKINFKNLKFANILRFRNLTIDIVKENGSSVDSGKKIFIKEIKFLYSDKPQFKPSMTVKDIKSRYVRNIDKESWEFPFSDPPKPEEEFLEIEVMRNLIFYALTGDVISEKLFMSYKPSHADAGEIHDALITWYEMTKEWNRKH